jgi:hypothetical protein
MRRVLPPALLVALLTAGCSPDRTLGSLAQAFEGLQRAPLCSQNLPMDWVSTWPVPLAAPGQYAVLFYALDRKAQDNSGLPRVRPTEPRGHAVFDTSGKVTECGSNPVDLVPLESERYPPEAMDLEEDAFDAATAKLLQLSDAVGAAYQRKAAVDKKTLAAYWSQFQLLGEPAMRPDYYKLNPAFWEWLRRENGASLPPAK